MSIDNLNDIKEKIHKYSTHEAAEYYALNFGFYAMGRACEIIGVNREMVFRGVDVESKGSVNWHDFVTFLKEVLSKAVSICRDGQYSNQPNHGSARPKLRNRCHKVTLPSADLFLYAGELKTHNRPFSSE